MTEKRFVRFMLTQTDDATIDYGVKDSQTDKWYYTIDGKNAKELCDLLNELDEENKQLKEEVIEWKQIYYGLWEVECSCNDEQREKEYYEVFGKELSRKWSN